MHNFPQKHNEDAEVFFLRRLAKSTTGGGMSYAFLPEKIDDAVPWADFSAKYTQFLAGYPYDVDMVLTFARKWRNQLLA